MLGCFFFFFRYSEPSPSQPAFGSTQANVEQVGPDSMGFSLSPSMLTVFKLTGFPPILKLTKNEAVNPSTIRHCKHPEVMMTGPVSLNSHLVLFFQVYKGEFQLPEFLKEKPQVLYLLLFLM